MKENMNYKAFWEFIELLRNNDLLQHVELIGSWCEYVYSQSGYLKGFDVGLRTLDIDFLIKNMKRPIKKVNLTEMAKEKGYTVDQDMITGSTKIYSPDLMEIEFLIEQKGSGSEQVIETNIGVNAQALRHVAVLKEYSKTISIFGMEICVPEPEAYIVHKMIINSQRGIKAEKDKEAIIRLMPFLNKSRLLEIIESLPKKDKKTVEKFVTEIAQKS